MHAFKYGRFKGRLEEDVFFGSFNKFSDIEVNSIVRDYIFEVVLFIYHKIENNYSVVLPNQKVSDFDTLYSEKDVKYHFAGNYVVFESEKIDLIDKIINTLSRFLSFSFPLDQNKLGIARHKYSDDAVRLTDVSERFIALLPFPYYIDWAYKEKGILETDEKTLVKWENTEFKRISELRIVRINKEILTFTLEYSFDTMEKIWSYS